MKTLLNNVFCNNYLRRNCSLSTNVFIIHIRVHKCVYQCRCPPFGVCMTSTIIFPPVYRRKKRVPFNTLFVLVSRINVVLEQVLQPCRRSTAKDGNRDELPNLQVNCCVPQPHHAGVQVIRAHWIWFTISFWCIVCEMYCLMLFVLQIINGSRSQRDCNKCCKLKLLELRSGTLHESTTCSKKK